MEGEPALAYVARPPGGAGPAVLVVHSWWGLTRSFTEFADRLADHGFVAGCADLFEGRTASTEQEARALRATRRREPAYRRLGRCVDELIAHPATLPPPPDDRAPTLPLRPNGAPEAPRFSGSPPAPSPGASPQTPSPGSSALTPPPDASPQTPLPNASPQTPSPDASPQTPPPDASPEPAGSAAIVGFSMGGHWALWLAQQPDQRIARAAVYYAARGGDYSNASSPVLAHYAEHDAFVSVGSRGSMARGLLAAGRRFVAHDYPGTHHWFAESAHPSYEPAAAERALLRTVDFLAGKPGT